MNPINISRQRLYREVWSMPVRELAPKYRVSDVALAKICRRYEIPLPGRGYWVRRQHGSAPRQRLLRPPTDPDLENVSIYPVRTVDEIAARAAGHGSPKPFGVIAVAPEGSPLRHPACRETARVLGSPDYYCQAGYARPHPRPGVLDVRVRAEEAGRALRVMDALLTALEESGVRIVLGEDHNGYSYTQAVVDGEPIPFFLEGESKGLALRFCSWGVVHGRWGDTNTKRIEDRVGEFANAIIAAVPVVRADREKQEAEAAAEEVAQARREAAEIARVTERNRRRNVLREVRRMHQALEVRAYVEALQAQHPNDARVAAWSAWARAFADAIDPLCAAPESLRSVEPPRVRLKKPELNKWGWFDRF